MRTEKLYSIGDAAAICRIPVKTLRYYDEIGLVQACSKNPETGYRYYEKEQLLQLYLVTRLKELRFSLHEIRDLLNSKDLAYLQKQVEEKLHQFSAEIQALQAQQIGGQFFLERISQGNSIIQSLQATVTPTDFSATTLNVESIPAQDVMFIRRILTPYRNEDAHIDQWGELIALAKREGAISVGPITVIYHNPPLEQFFTNACDYEVYMPVMHTKNHRNFKRMDAFQAVTTLHVGSYADLIHPSLMAMQWIRENGYCIVGHLQDSFLVSPIDVRQSSAYITKIIIPVEAEQSPKG